MRVRLRTSGHLAEYLPATQEGVLEVDAPAGAPVSELLASLGVPSGLVMGVLVEGRRRPLSYLPHDGEEVVLISPPAGG